MSRYDYVAVGHVTCDLLGEGDAQHERPGGTAFYSALQAARLGSSALVVTQGVPAQIERLLLPYEGELDLHVIPAAQTTTLATHDRGAGRAQSVLAWAGAIVDAPAVEAKILHLAPVARETSADWCGEAGFVGVTPQGLIRDWRPGGEVRTAELDPALLPRRFDAAVISEHERPCCRSLFAAADICGACVAVTAGPRPASVRVRTETFRSAPPRAIEIRDDLGAGDVFAAAFFTALAEGREPPAAAAFAHAAAAIRIASTGPDAIGTRSEVEALLV